MNIKKAISFHFLPKLERSELEASYQVIHNENIQLKNALQQQCNETNSLRCHLIDVLNLLNCKKLLRPSIPVHKQETGLQFYVQLLNEKISVLTHQLLNHSRFHTEVHKCYRGTTQYSNSTCSNVKKFLSSQLTEPLTNKIGDNLTNSNNVKEILLQNYQDEEVKHENKQEDVNKYINSEEIKVADNIDIIRLKVLIKRLTIQNTALLHHADSTDKETLSLRKELNELQAELGHFLEQYICGSHEKPEELSMQIRKEKEKYSSVSTLVVELTSLRQRNKILHEEIREMQEEKEALKDAYHKLLEELNDINENMNANTSPNNQT